MKRLKNKDLLSIADLSLHEIELIFRLAAKLKKKNEKLLRGKTLGMIFEKSSTRTRVSFEVGMYQLGGHGIFLSKDDLQLGRGETVADTARVLSRYLSGIMIRAYSHQDVIELAKNSSIPVINGLTDLSHPCQALSDFFTIGEYKKRFKGLKLAFVGDGNNVAHSLLMAASLLGTHISIASPDGYKVNPDIHGRALEFAKKSGSRIVLTSDPAEAAKEADILYTDVWVSMGQENEKEEKTKIFQNYQINASLLKIAKKDAMVMHCLPAHREEEITSEALDGKNSAVLDQAENRLHAQKAIMALLLG